jgi:hypothetical protein
LVNTLSVKYKDWFFIFIGIVGAITTFLGTAQGSTQIFFVLGSSLLLIAALYYNLMYFVALEIILIAGHGSILLGIGDILQIAMPILLCVQLFIFYFLSGRLNNIFLLIGVIGIALISLGFYYNNQWVFLVGSISITTYAIYNSKTQKAAMIWVVLNTCFALSALYKIINNL